VSLDDVGARRDALDRHGMQVVIAATLPRDGHAIDVGAHRGAILRDIVRIAPLGRHLAYEPLPDCYKYLCREFPSVDVRRTALSDENGKTTFVHVEQAPEYSGLRRRNYPGFEDSPREVINVRTERLDDTLPSDFCPNLIKIDVEGAEMLVMRGAVQTLRTYRPVVIFEHGIGAVESYGYVSAEIHDLLCGEMGMRIFDFDGQGPYTRERFIEVFPEPIWNFVAVPG
jgi:FkbM family methyltransferase